jgi:glycosyltransferase involved in cell wall biosynthesis
MLKILHVSPAIAPRYGGPSVVALATCRALAAAGHDVQIVTTDADGAGRLDVPHGIPQIVDGVTVTFFRRTMHEGVKWSPALSRWLRAHVSAFDVVDVHAVFSHSSVAAGRACVRAGVPYVVRPHGALDPWSLRRKRGLKAVLFACGVRRLLARASRVQYTTAEEQRLAERRLSWLPPGAVVPLGVDEAAIPTGPGRPADPPYVLVLSRLEPKKGLELLIDAFHAVAVGPRAAWRLVIAGSGDAAYVGELVRRANAGPAAGRVTFPGWVSGSAKAALIGGAAVFASPSLQENFGLSVAEAMAAAVPVLVTPGVNLAPDIETAGAGWVIARDAAAFSRGLASALDDGPGRLERGAAARRLARRFRWDASAEAVVSLYMSVVHRAPSARQEAIAHHG